MRIFNSANILVPCDMGLSKWSVVACDQYTSQPEYWDEVKKNVGEHPSALSIIYPEIYLGEKNGAERIQKINATMSDYLDNGVFEEYLNSLILVERKQRDGRVRYGIIGTVDLEEYDFHKGSTSRIRATEGTVLERIPPRVKVRENAPLEMPHIIMLIDDDKKTVIEPIRDKREQYNTLYDFDLQMNSGHLTGYLINNDDAESVLSAIEALGDEKTFKNKYKTDKAVLQFAVGDGNHSLATAKTCWENLKKNLSEEEAKNHPARFALVELMNVHDEALEFEAIHRVVFCENPQKILDELLEYYPKASFSDNGGQKIDYCFGDIKGSVYIDDAPSKLAVGTLERFLDECKIEHKTDYIHGTDVVEELTANGDAIGFILPSMTKSQLFETVIFDGVLPRKTFSMGEAQDKKFYLECKIIQRNRK